MSQLDEFEKLVLEGARAGMDPGARHQKELFAALELAALKGRVPSLPEDEVPSLELERVSTVAKRLSLGAQAVASSGALLKISSLAALAGGLLGFYGGYLTFGGEQPSTLEPARPSPLVVSAPKEVARPAEPSLTKPDEMEVHWETTKAPTAGRETGSEQARRQVKARKKTEKPQLLKFHEEMSHLRRAQSALKEGNPGLALGLMQSLDELRPDGALLPERRMTKVLALCSLDRKSEAQSVAKRLLGSKSDSVYSARLRTTCALPLEN